MTVVLLNVIDEGVGFEVADYDKGMDVAVVVADGHDPLNWI